MSVLLRKICVPFGILAAALLMTNFALADDVVTSSGRLFTINSADTAWLIVATALVMIMTPGLAFFYSGMVHSTNVVATIMHSYMKLCVISLVWVLWAYSIAFGPSIGGLFGGLSYIGFHGVGGAALSESVHIPHNLFAMFQGMFAVITAAIITGAFAERVRLGPVMIFSTIWVTLVYAPVAHWVWGGGWIATHLKALDFAGGAVVHINSGVAGLVAALVLGRRIRVNSDANRPHNLPLTVVGASLLWFGWFGFNAGSALAANELATLAFANTNIAAAAGAVGWFLIELFHKGGRSTALGIISGSVAGLVAITPAAGFVTTFASIIIGLGGGLVCYLAVVVVKPKLGYDDSLDAFGIHGVGGFWGAIATGLFATTSVNSAGADGLFYGGFSLVFIQILASLAVVVYSAGMTYAILQVMRKFIRIRVSEEEEARGLDESQHGEVGYIR